MPVRQATPRRARVNFRERAEVLDFLLEVSRITAETLDLDKLLASVATIVKQVVPYDLIAILLYFEKPQALRIRYAIGHREELVRGLEIGLGEGIVGTAALNREPVLVDDVRQDSRYLNALDAVRSELAVPMISRQKLVGVIDLQSTRERSYSENDRTIIRLIAARVGASIENARLYRRIDRQHRTLQTLAQLSQRFSLILDLDELLGKIAESVRTLANYDAFSIYLIDAEQKVLRHRFSVRYDERVKLDNIPLGKGITGASAETRAPVRVRNTAEDPRYIASHPDIISEIAVPLMVQDRVVGVLDLESEQLGFFTEDHQQTLTLLAPQIASSIENARLYEELARREQRMETDLKAARSLQRILLPRDVEVHGLEVGIRSRPAREISGDVYEFYDHSDDYTVIAFGDVSGKGAAAALYGALISGLLRTLAPRKRSPALLMQALNEALLERRVDAQYATLTVLLWEARGRTLTIVNAGGEAPLVYRHGELITLQGNGFPIGLLEARDYEEAVFEMETGDSILLYSDGIVDQLNEQEQDFGQARVREFMEKSGKQAPRAAVDSLIAQVDEYRGAMPLTDDQTAVILKVL